MKLVTTKFKSGGLHEKHVVATWNLVADRLPSPSTGNSLVALKMEVARFVESSLGAESEQTDGAEYF